MGLSDKKALNSIRNECKETHCRKISFNFIFVTHMTRGGDMSRVEKLWEGICAGWRKDGRGYVQGREKTGDDMSGVEKLWEGICPGWRKDGRGYVRGGKLWEGICPGWRKDGRGYVRVINIIAQSPYEADVFLRPLSFLLKTVFYILITLLSLCSNKDECILHVCVFLHGLSYCVELDFIS